MWGSFGKIAFKTTQTPETIEINQKAKYAKVALYGQKEKLHFTGFEPNQVKLTLTLNASFCKPDEEIKKLEELKNKKEVHPLMIGDVNLGNYVIQEIKTDITKTLPNGKILIANVELTLLEVVDNGKNNS